MYVIIPIQWDLQQYLLINFSCVICFYQIQIMCCTYLYQLLLNMNKTPKSHQISQLMALHNNPNCERKLIANARGIFVAVILILYLLACTALNFTFSSIWTSSSFSEPLYLIFIITGYRPSNFGGKLILEMDIVTFIAYHLMCLIFLYVPIRALCQKTFVAGKPSKAKMWPFIIAFILRISSESLLIIQSTNLSVGWVICRIFLTLLFASFLFSIYTTDDDNLNFTTGLVNMKPWTFEKKMKGGILLK